MLASTIVFICMNLWIIFYLHHMKSIKCTCALTWQRNVIMTISTSLVILPIVSLFAKEFLQPYVMIYAPFAIVAGIINTMLIFQYANQVKKEACDCVDSSAANALKIIAIIYIVMYTLALVGVAYILYRFKTQFPTSKK